MLAHNLPMAKFENIDVQLGPLDDIADSIAQ
jgi:hypothetical protein